jgi:hypothetical protein
VKRKTCAGISTDTVPRKRKEGVKRKEWKEGGREGGVP